LIDKKSSNVKNSVHGFFLSIATTVAEPSTILPLIIHHFSGSSILVGIFASLLKGGAIFVQMVAAFYSRSYKYMMPSLRWVFLVRFLSWFGIGLVIYFLGNKSDFWTLWGIAILLFIFSFSSGFGAIYFKDIIGKIFTRKFMGKSMALRQFFSGLGAIISGTTAGWFLANFQPPDSFALLFIFSAILMGIGLIAFSTIPEPAKEKIDVVHGDFLDFLKESWQIFQTDKKLKYQIYSYLYSYGYLIGLPFIILDAQNYIKLDGYIIGILLSVQMAGSMLSNIFWGWLVSREHLDGDHFTIYIASFLAILSFILALIFHNIYIYIIIFFILGASIDGTKLSFGNLIIAISPEEKRQIYLAMNSNISSIGLFFPILGGLIVSAFGYISVYIFSILAIILSLVFYRISIK
jgi:MFS family permease